MIRNLLLRMLLLLCLVGLMFNFGISKPMELTPAKVKEIIATKANDVLDAWISPGNKDFSEGMKKKISEFRPKLSQRFLINDVFPNGKHYIATVTINLPKMPAQPFMVNFKIKRDNSQWEICEVQALDKQWLPLKEALFKAHQYIEAPLAENEKIELQKSKQKSTMGDLATIGAAIRNYMSDFDHAPKANSIKQLRKILEPFYIKTLPLHDGWGNEFHYKVDKDNPRKYWIASGGSDGKLIGFEQLGTYIVYDYPEFAFDFIFSNGKFTFAPLCR